ncbi:hypothetical protein DFJ74DRAFT_725482 [Hyaloraphidium curvatum]|nr:hypothetical protein DFJ74DRAFT_725482 [Hyaloraphidium curvatum]
METSGGVAVVSVASYDPADGVRLQFTLGKNPDSNIFDIRAHLAPRPPRPKSSVEPAAVSPPSADAAGLPDRMDTGQDGEAAKETPDGDANPAGDGDNVSRESADEEGDESSEAEAKDTKKRKRRKLDEEDFYDFDDPFIDDSDLRELVGSVMVEPKVKGYFMWRGNVETMRVAPIASAPESPRKRQVVRKRKQPAGAGAAPGSAPAPKKARTGEAGARGASAKDNDPAPKRRRKKEGSEVPAATAAANAGKPSVDTGTVGTAAKPLASPIRSPLPGSPSVTSVNGGPAAEKKKVKVTEDTPLDPALRTLTEELRALASKESWENKQKFPITLKPLLLDAARKAIELSADETLEMNFLHELTLILPYNKVTLRNLIQRHLLPERIEQKRKHLEAAYAAARERITRQTVPTEPKQEDGAAAGPAGFKIAWNKDLRAALYLIYELEFSIAKLEDALAAVNKQEPKYDEVKVKALAYDHIFALFPEGIIPRDAISRNFSLHRSQLAKREESTEA